MGVSALIAVITLLLSGCSLRSNKIITYYDFTYPSPVRGSKAPIAETLMVYPFLLGPSVESQGLVVAQAKGDQKSLRLHQWRENPADMISDLILRDLGQSGLFERAVDQLSNERYRYALEGTIQNIQGLVRDGKASAKIDLDVTLIDFDAPWGADKTLLSKPYSAEIPSKDPQPESIVAALNLAIMEISERLRGDIRSALEKKADGYRKESPRRDHGSVGGAHRAPAR